MKSTTTAAYFIGLALVGIAPASAQTGPHQDHAAHAAKPPANIAELPSVKAFTAANDRMHKEMAITFSGNADVDFVRGMIPHHQGAIDMAKVVLEHGKDPGIRRLARGIIRAQNTEIAQMKAWLKKNEKSDQPLTCPGRAHPLASGFPCPGPRLDLTNAG